LGSAEVHSEKKRSRHKTADVFYAVVGVVTNNTWFDECSCWWQHQQ